MIRDRKLGILLAVELLLLLLGILSLFGETGIVYSRDEILGQELSLKPGVYTVRLSYTGAGKDYENIMTVTDEEAGYYGLFANGVGLFSGDSSASMEFWLLESTDSLRIYAGKDENFVDTGMDPASVIREDHFEITDLQVIRTNDLESCILFLLLLLFVLVDGVILTVRYDRIYGIDKGAKLTAAVLTGVILLLSIPLFTDFSLAGDDTGFHLLRIEGLKSGWQEGQLPVRIQPYWLKGHGYAVSVFYSDLFLVIPALLRLIGFPIVFAYGMYVLCVNIATVLIAYICFKRCTESRAIGCAGSILYIMSSYHLHNVYVRGAVGEYTAMAFLPLLCYGFYRVFTENPKDRGYRTAWVPLVFGFSGIIQSHVLTCEMVAFMVILLCLVLWRRVFRKETFWVLAKTVIITVFLNMWYLLPFLQYMATGDFMIHHAFARKIQQWGIYPAHLLTSFFPSDKIAQLYLYGMEESASLGIGTALILLLLAYCYYRFVYGRKVLLSGPGKVSASEGRKADVRMRAADMAVLFGAFTMLLTLSVFPWDKIQKIGGAVNSLVSSLQFPSRFLSLSCVLLSFGGCLFLAAVRGQIKGKLFSAFLYGICVISVVMGGYQLNAALDRSTFFRVYDEGGMGNMSVGGAEYLPAQTDKFILRYDSWTAGDGVELLSCEKDPQQLKLTLECRNTGKTASYVEVPVLYYKGYQADGEDGKLLDTGAGDNGLVRISIPAGWEGRLALRFVSPWYWRASELCSAVTVLWMIYVCFRSRRRTDGKTKEAE